jgi:hypothetical protein
MPQNNARQQFNNIGKDQTRPEANWLLKNVNQHQPIQQFGQCGNITDQSLI